MGIVRLRFAKVLLGLVVVVQLCGCTIGVVITNSPDVPGNSPPRPY